MVLGEVIGIVYFASFPVDAALALTDSVLDPVESHVHGFGTFGFDGVVGDFASRGVVCAWGSGARLWVSHLLVCGPD